MPTAFSPNGDGTNDYLCPIGTPYEGYELQLFNRWGKRVFYSQALEDCWDGRYQNEEQSMGVYVYTLRTFDCQGREVVRSGGVTLVR